MKTITKYEAHIDDVMFYTTDAEGEICNLEEQENRELQFVKEMPPIEIIEAILNLKDQLIMELKKDLIDLQKQIDDLKEGRE